MEHTGNPTMHSARAIFEDDLQGDDAEPSVLSYLQFRNHLGLLDWRRRRAEYEQDAAARVAPQRKPYSAPDRA
jgi:hypothetical protein